MDVQFLIIEGVRIISIILVAITVGYFIKKSRNSKHYKCVNNTCQITEGGPYLTSDCNNNCKGVSPSITPAYDCVSNVCQIKEGGKFTDIKCGTGCGGKQI